MSTAVLEQTLRSTLWGKGLRFWIAGGILLAVLLIDVIYFCVTHSDETFIDSYRRRLRNGRYYKPKLSAKGYIFLEGVTLSAVLVWMCISLVPMHLDISREQYIQADAIYSRTEESSEPDWFTNGCAYVEIDGEAIRVELPRGWTEEDFPLGDFSGTVWYGKQSKVLLAFYQNEMNN